jgi:hypothetical protein
MRSRRRCSSGLGRLRPVAAWQGFFARQHAVLVRPAGFGQKQPLALDERIRPIVLSAQHTVQPLFW